MGQGSMWGFVLCQHASKSVHSHLHLGSPAASWKGRAQCCATLAPRASVWGHGDEERPAPAVGAGTSLSCSDCEGDGFPIERT